MGAQEVDQLVGVPLLGLMEARPTTAPVDNDQVLFCPQGEEIQTDLLEHVLDVPQRRRGFLRLAEGVAVAPPAVRPHCPDVVSGKKHSYK